MKVELYGQGGNVVNTLTLCQAFPFKWEFPSLDATSSAPAVEKITLTVEDILYVSTASSGNQYTTPV